MSYKPDPKKFTPAVLKELIDAANDLCSPTDGGAVAALSGGDDPFPSINYWFPNPLTASQPCYVTCSSNRPDLDHRIGFFQGTTEVVVAGVYFMQGNSGIAYLSAPAAGTYSLKVQARLSSTSAWGFDYTVTVTLA